MPLRNKAGLSESSISKTPTAFLWGQILQPHCVRQLPLLKGASFGRPGFIVRFLDCARNDRRFISTELFPFVISTEARSAERRNLGAQRRTKGSVLLSTVRRINCALRSVDRALRLDFSAVLEMTRAEKSTGFSPFVISTEARSAERRNLGAQRRTKGSVPLSAVRRMNCALRSVDRALRLDFSAALEMTRA